MIKKWFEKRRHSEEGESPSSSQVSPSDREKGDAGLPEPTAPGADVWPGDDQESAQGGEGFYRRLKERLGRTRGGFVRQMDEILLGRKEMDPRILDELEEILVTADMGVSTVQEIFSRVREEARRSELDDPAALRLRLREHVLRLLQVPAPPLTWNARPFVVLVAGVNGVGKTTTIAKLGHMLRQEGKEVLLIAADTFRAAAIEQLETWGRRIGVPVIRHKTGSDPSAVAFDGMEAGVKRGVDVVIIDTAGRLHTKVNLMEELKKIRRVVSKKIPEAPHEVLLVLDATTGQNAVSQAKLFQEAAGVTGIALTKLDGTAKGGIVVSIAHQLQIPIRFIGIGEGMEDLRPFDPEEFVEAIFSRDD